MQNPFKKRATEFIEDAASFVALTSPAPLKLFFENDSSVLFDRLVTVIGTPGSGKTTLARLMDIDTLFKLAGTHTDNAKNLKSALVNYKVIKDDKPQYLSYRLPSGTNLRDIWELPYSEVVRGHLLKSFIQAKAVLGWLRRLEKNDINIGDVHIKINEGYESQSHLLQAEAPDSFRQQARMVEEKILDIITALLPPEENELLSSAVNWRFNAFELIDSFSIPLFDSIEQTISLFALKPLLIIDDAHELHPDQFDDLTRWLKNREMKIARWLMTRVDAIAHEDFRKALSNAENNSETPGTTMGRDHIFKLIQCERKDRRTFRNIAVDIAKHYIQQMPSFNRKGIQTLEQCLIKEAIGLKKSDCEKLQISVQDLLAELRLPEHQIKKIRASIPNTLASDQFLAVYRILLNRERKRAPQADIFGFTGDSEEELLLALPETEDEDGKEISKTKADLIRGAELQLLHDYDRPFFFSFERLADASSGNIEQFINLADSLVDNLETKLLRGRPVLLDAKEQHQCLTERATKIINEWNFPHSEATRRLVEFIAHKCVAKTTEANAPLADGANGFGIPQTEMNALRNYPQFALLLHFALAYNALTLKENYQCKSETWCLFVLGGLPCIRYRLTLNQGGFCEGHLAELIEAIKQ